MTLLTLPPAMRALEVTRYHFQTPHHEAAWRSGVPLVTERPTRWKVPGRWAAIMWRHYGRRCVHCGTADNLTIGHIVPVVFGGSNEPGNIRPECMPCNAAQWTPELAALAAQARAAA